MLVVAENWVEEMTAIGELLTEQGWDGLLQRWDRFNKINPLVAGMLKDLPENPWVQESFECLGYNQKEWLGALHASLVMAEVYIGHECLEHMFKIDRYAAATVITEWFYDPDSEGENLDNEQWPYLFVAYLITNVCARLYPQEICKRALAILAVWIVDLPDADKVLLRNDVRCMTTAVRERHVFH
jgi:hypothetical protein